MRRAPLEPDDDAYELQDHEFTLEPEDSAPEPALPAEERAGTAGGVPPLPAWAATSRELLEPAASRARKDATFYDDQPTPSVESVDFSRSALLALREELVHAAKELQQREQQIENLERTLAETRRNAAAVEAELERQNAELLGQVRGQTLLIGELQRGVKQPSAGQVATASASAAPAPDQVDDLRRIHGLGARCVERLAGLGIRSFAQIASWTRADVERIAPQLSLPPKRIEREGWIKQARTLSERAGAAPRRASKSKPASLAPKRKTSRKRQR